MAVFGDGQRFLGTWIPVKNSEPQKYTRLNLMKG